LSNKPKHIAIIRLSAMGDVAMAVPVILSLLNKYPEVKITVVSKSFFKPIFSNIPNVHFLSVHIHHQHKGILGLYRLYKDIKALKVDQIADLHNVLRSIVLRNIFALSGKKVAFTNKGRKEKKALTRLENKEIKPLKTMFERHVETFHKLGYKLDLQPPLFLNKMKIPHKAIELLGDKDQKWIGIAPFAYYESKTYPIDLMKEVVNELAKNSSIKILLFGGGKKEISLLNEVVKDKADCFNFAGIVSFEQELQLISNLDIMLSMDSGNAHLAAMFGIKTITLWGATHPFAGFSPFNQPITNCLLSDREKYPLLPTSAYGNKKVEGYEDAMRTILPKTIIDKIQKELN
jgi:ADP-heptose:LPS heptosyltransferase